MPLHRLTTLTLGVPSVEASAAFFRDFGLAETGSGSFATRDGGEQLRLEQSRRRGLRRLGVGAADDDDLDRIAARAAAFGTDLRPEWSTAADGSRELVVHEPVTGVPVSVTVAPRLEASVPRTAPMNGPGSYVVRTDRPSDAVLHTDPVRVSNLTHVVLSTPDQPTTLRFATEVLGFEISDQIPGIIAFSRCGEVHHNLAVQAAPVSFVHHVAFEVDSVDDVVRGGSAMVQSDPERQLWGVGRHAIGSNWFWYLREPGGTFIEYTADIDRISRQDLYRPKDWQGHEFLYSFGPPPPRQFLEPSDLAELMAAD